MKIKQADATDPMMEIFIEECLDLITQYETYMGMAEEKQAYDMTLINEIFRITHTIKADATMMMFECITVPVRVFEKLLYYYRDENGCVVNYPEFTALLRDVTDFVRLEIDKILDGNADDTDGNGLRDKIQEYRDELASGLLPEVVESVEKNAKDTIMDEPMRFYIGSCTADKEPDDNAAGENAAADGFEAGSIEAAQAESIIAAAKCKTSDSTYEHAGDSANDEKNVYAWINKRNTVTTDEIKELYDTVCALQRVEAKLINRFQDRFSEVSDIIYEYHNYVASMWKWVGNATTAPVSQLSLKLHRVVEEMNTRLDKNVHLSICGEDCLVERHWLDNISSVLIHIIRNSIDHGIESKEMRLKNGKDEHGNISVAYSIKNDYSYFEAVIEDDGRGFDVEKIREAAIQKKLISETDNLKEEEIINLVFEPGLTTSNKANIYSGRGVGMDAAKHSIEELGGTMSIFNNTTSGTRVVITIPFHNAMLHEEDTANEDIDSRR